MDFKQCFFLLKTEIGKSIRIKLIVRKPSKLRNHYQIAGYYTPWMEDGYPLIVIMSSDGVFSLKEITTLLHEFGHHINVILPQFWGTQSKTGFSYSELNSDLVVFKEEISAWLNGFIYLWQASEPNWYYKLLISLSIISGTIEHILTLARLSIEARFVKKNPLWYQGLHKNM